MRHGIYTPDHTKYDEFDQMIGTKRTGAKLHHLWWPDIDGYINGSNLYTSFKTEPGIQFLLLPQPYTTGPNGYDGQPMPNWTPRNIAEKRVDMGVYDRLARRLIANGFGSADLCLGHEMDTNPGYYPHSYGSNGDGSNYHAGPYYIPMIQNIITVMKNVVGADFKFVFNTVDWGNVPLYKVWWGDKYVDKFGIDLYDRLSGVRDNQERWGRIVLMLNQRAELCRGLGIKLTFPEWGLVQAGDEHYGGGDDEIFMRNFLTWCKMNSDVVDSIYYHQVNNPTFRHNLGSFYPKATAIYKELIKTLPSDNISIPIPQLPPLVIVYNGGRILRGATVKGGISVYLQDTTAVSRVIWMVDGQIYDEDGSPPFETSINTTTLAADRTHIVEGIVSRNGEATVVTATFNIDQASTPPTPPADLLTISQWADVCRLNRDICLYLAAYTSDFTKKEQLRSDAQAHERMRKFWMTLWAE